MSYCRFSSDNFKSDVYVYESTCGGITIHIANNRVIGDIPLIPTWSESNQKEFFEAHKKQSLFLETAKSEKINLPLAGETLIVDDQEECINSLLNLINIGYFVPHNVIDILKQEIIENNNDDLTKN